MATKNPKKTIKRNDRGTAVIPEYLPDVVHVTLRFSVSACEWRALSENVALLLVELRRHDGYVIPLEDAAQACGLTVDELRLQLRIGAIYADRSRELDPKCCPVAWLAKGRPAQREPRVIEVAS